MFGIGSPLFVAWMTTFVTGLARTRLLFAADFSTGTRAEALYNGIGRWMLRYRIRSHDSLTFFEYLFTKKPCTPTNGADDFPFGSFGSAARRRS